VRNIIIIIKLKDKTLIITSISAKLFEKPFMEIVGPMFKTIDRKAHLLIIQADLTKFSIPLETMNAYTIETYFVVYIVCT